MLNVNPLNNCKDSLGQFLDSKSDGSFYVGHASVLARVNGFLFLIDGVLPRPLFLDSWYFYPDLKIDERLCNVDGVLISHCHEDHFDMNFLRKLKKNTPIYIGKDRIGFEKLLEDQSLNVVRVPEFTPYELKPGVNAFFIPSDHNSFDSSIVLKGKEFSLFQGNDNFLNDATIARMVSVCGSVTHAYVPYAYVWWYPFCLTSITKDQRLAEGRRLTSLNMSIGAKISKALKATLVVPSAGNLVFYEGADSILNREIASPFDFVDYVYQNHPELKQATLPLLSGDYALSSKDSSTVYTFGVNKDKFFDEMGKYLTSVNSKMPPVPKVSPLNLKTCAALVERLSKTPSKKFDADVCFYRSDSSNEAVWVSMDTYKVSFGDSNVKKEGRKCMKFSVQPHAFEKWRLGEIDFETVLNSQRFLVHRDPEEFVPEIWEVIRAQF